MNDSKTIVQCQYCGSQFTINHSISNDKLFVSNIWCPHCNELRTVLNLGDDIDDVYALYNVNLDNRFF